jgi:hypothetical protein
MNLFQANRQWAERPADERFASLREMHDACKGYYDRAAESVAPLKSLTTVADADEVTLVNRETGNSATFTHWADRRACQLPPGAAAGDCRDLHQSRHRQSGVGPERRDDVPP